MSTQYIYEAPRWLIPVLVIGLPLLIVATIGATMAYCDRTATSRFDRARMTARWESMVRGNHYSRHGWDSSAPDSGSLVVSVARVVRLKGREPHILEAVRIGEVDASGDRWADDLAALREEAATRAEQLNVMMTIPTV